MNICYLCNEYPPGKNGGIGTFTKELAERAVLEGHRVFVVGVYPDISTDKIEKVNGVEVVKLSMPFKSEVLSRFKIYRYIKSLDVEFGLDLIEAQEHSGFLAFWPKTRFKKVIRLHGSIVYFRKEFNEWTMKDYIWRILERNALLNCDQIISVSKYTAEKTRLYFDLKDNVNIKVIYNGVALPSEKKTNYQQKNNKLNVIFAGSLLSKKGFISLAYAWNEFVTTHPNAILHIAGKNNDHQLEKFLDIVSNKRTIKYHGVLSKEELNYLYQNSDIAVFPSFVEAFSLAPMEAMAVGLPVIYSVLSSGKELISDISQGYLVNPNYPAEISSALNDFVNMTPLARERMGLTGRSLIESNYDIDNVMEVNLDFYMSLLRKSNDD